MKRETPQGPATGADSTVEGRRLARASETGWRTWGPYLSERQWGVVREDYSADGSAWTYFPHDHARSRAYRWGEDGIGGFADEGLNLCLAPAFWNGLDPILKERLFGLDNTQGNHGEDVKELAYFLDGTPTHSYMRMLYKYPQKAFPYQQLVDENAKRGLDETEYELLDTGIFDDGAYFDCVVEYAKAGADDIVMRVTACNRGTQAATLRILPQLWARNIWSWGDKVAKPLIEAVGDDRARVFHPRLPTMYAIFPGADALLFCENETNVRRLFGVEREGHFKDAIHAILVGGDAEAVNPQRFGTKVAGLYTRDVAAGGAVAIHVRLRASLEGDDDAASLDAIIERRRAECDEFYAALQAGVASEDARLVQRQALAGLLWSKQFYEFDVRRWLQGDPGQPAPPPERRKGRNRDWPQLAISHVISMPDTWEFPWFAAWDLAFHCVAMALVDPAFAKDQLLLLTRSRSQHPRGQLPAYEWNFDDVNPPVQAWAALRIYEMDRRTSGVADTIFLERMFQALVLNFTWWVNREDDDGHDLFEGGFLGLDNIGLYDRSMKLPNVSALDQADGTAWVAMYALNLMRIALELAVDNAVYEEPALKFLEHFLYISEAMHAEPDVDETGLWDDKDGFYYDVLQSSGDEPGRPIRVRSMVGLIPLFAVEVLDGAFLQTLPGFRDGMRWLLDRRADLARLVSRFTADKSADLQLLSLMRRERMNRVLSRLLDEEEFLSDYGVRSLSKAYRNASYDFELGGKVASIQYEPGEGRTRLYGGNSNWRGPIWMPVNYLIIEALRTFQSFYGDAHRVECPTGSGALLSLGEIADVLSARIGRIFLKDENGRRATFGDSPIEQTDAHFRDLMQFHEYFHGDTGRGLGAAHQTGWTALIAMLLHPRFKDARNDAAPATADPSPTGAVS